MMTERKPIARVATGISGLDEILDGGLPKDRVIRVTGNSGTGKTLLGIEFLVHGMRESNENAVMVTFEEAGPKVAENVRYSGTNEYPFLIGSDGFIVLPITSMPLNCAAPLDRVATGVQGLDEMLDGGPHRGSVVLISGRPGSAKTSISMSMVNAACARGEKCLILLYEESPIQMERNMESTGTGLKQWTDSGFLRIWAARPLEFGLENHLAIFVDLLDSFNPSIVAIDGLTAFGELGMAKEVLKFMARKVNILTGFAWPARIKGANARKLSRSRLDQDTEASHDHTSHVR